MHFVALTVLCSVLVTLYMKQVQVGGGNRLVIGGVNYIVASLIGGVFAAASGVPFDVNSALFGSLVGAGFVGGYLIFMRAITTMGLAVPVSIARTSLVVPVAASLIVYHEMATGRVIAGIGMGLAAFVALGAAQRQNAVRSGSPGGRGGIWMLASVFLINGTCDFATKVAQHSGMADAWYLPCIFAAAGVFSGIVLLVRRGPRPVVRPRDVMQGIILAIPNFFGVFFVIKSLNLLPGVVVFPIVGASTVVASTVASVLIWKESPNRLAWIGIGLATLTVVLLGS